MDGCFPAFVEVDVAGLVEVDDEGSVGEKGWRWRGRGREREIGIGGIRGKIVALVLKERGWI